MQQSIDKWHQQAEQAKQRAYNSKRMGQALIGGIIAMTVYGVLLPIDWQERFGLLGQPIVWITETLPGFAKLARFSTIPELLRGFYGLSLYVMPLFGVFLYIYQTRYLNWSLRSMFANSKRPFWETFCILYLFFVPIIIGCLWLVYMNPVQDRGPSPHAYERGFIYLNEILDNRFALACYGSGMTIGASLFICLLMHALVGPIVLLVKFIKGDKE